MQAKVLKWAEIQLMVNTISDECRNLSFSQVVPQNSIDSYTGIPLITCLAVEEVR